MTLDTLKTVSLSDPALDLEAMDSVVADFLRDRDMNRVRIIAGARPRCFHVGHIDMMAFRSYVANGAESSESAQVPLPIAWRAFECGVTRVEMEDGSILEPSREESLANGAIRKRWRDEQMEAFSPAEVWEIGALAYTRALLGKARRARYPLPPGWLHVWMSRVPHSAAAADAAALSDPG